MRGWARWYTGYCTRNWSFTIRINYICTTQNLSCDFEIQTDHLISARRPDLIIIKKKNKTCRILDFAIPGDHKIKLKENEKNWKSCRTWKWRLHLVQPTKDSYRDWWGVEITGRMETIQTTALLRSARKLRGVLETWGDLLSLKLLWKTIC